MPRVFLDVHLHVRVPGGRFLHRADLVPRDVRVAAAEVELDRRADLGEQVEAVRHRRAVERDQHVHRGLRGDQVTDRAAQAEPDHPEAAVHLGQRGQRAQRGQFPGRPARRRTAGPGPAHRMLWGCFLSMFLRGLDVKILIIMVHTK